METTIVIIKPDAIVRGLIGTIVSRLEAKGLLLVGTKMIYLDDEILKIHYGHLADKPFFPGIQTFMQQTPVILQAWRGAEAVRVVRSLVGATNGRDAAVGSIRGDLSVSIQANLVHASDTIETAQEELGRFFRPDELYTYAHPLGSFINAPDELN